MSVAQGLRISKSSAVRGGRYEVHQLQQNFGIGVTSDDQPSKRSGKAVDLQESREKVTRHLRQHGYKLDAQGKISADNESSLEDQGSAGTGPAGRRRLRSRGRSLPPLNQQQRSLPRDQVLSQVDGTVSQHCRPASQLEQDVLTEECAQLAAARGAAVARAIQQQHTELVEADRVRIEHKQFMERIREEMLPQIEERMKVTAERDPSLAAADRATLMAAQHGEALREWTGEIDRVKLRMDKIVQEIEEEELITASDPKARTADSRRKHTLQSMRNKTYLLLDTCTRHNTKSDMLLRESTAGFSHVTQTLLDELESVNDDSIVEMTEVVEKALKKMQGKQDSMIEEVQKLWENIALKKNAASGSPTSHSHMRERLQQLKNMIVDRDERLQEFKLESETVDRDVEKQTRELEIAEKELHVIKDEMELIEEKIARAAAKIKAEKKKKMKLTMKLAAVVGKKQQEMEKIERGELDRSVLTLTRALDVKDGETKTEAVARKRAMVEFGLNIDEIAPAVKAETERLAGDTASGAVDPRFGGKTIKLSKRYNPFLPGANLAASGIIKRDLPEVEQLKAKVLALQQDCTSIEGDITKITQAIRKATSLR